MSGMNANPIVYKSKAAAMVGPTPVASGMPRYDVGHPTDRQARDESRSFLLPIVSRSDEHRAALAATNLSDFSRASPSQLGSDTQSSTAHPSPLRHVGGVKWRSSETRADENGVYRHRDEFTDAEIFHIIRRINDPEHPLTLEQLNVVQLKLCSVDDSRSTVHVNFTPTIPHCSMATLIGLSITTKLIRSLPLRFKITVAITPGTHNQEAEVNKQLADKERVAAALENSHLLRVVNGCILNTDGDWP